MAGVAADSGSSSVAETDDVEDLVGEDAKLGIRKPLTRAARKPLGDTTHTIRSTISTDVAIPRAPFYGSRVVDDIDLDDVFAFANETALFKGQWRFKQGSRPAEEYQSFVRDKVRPVYGRSSSVRSVSGFSSRELFNG